MRATRRRARVQHEPHSAPAQPLASRCPTMGHGAGWADEQCTYKAVGVVAPVYMITKRHT